MPLADDTAQLRADPVSGRTPPPPGLLLGVAYAEALRGLSEGGIPIGAALFSGEGELLGSGRNRRVQQGDPSLHAETDAFRAAGRLRDYRSTIMVSTLAPCWYCSGLIRQFGIGTVIVGESVTLSGGLDWLTDHGVRVSVLNDTRCIELMAQFVADHPELWAEDIGEPVC
jgi:cytosine deaminase